MIVRLGVSGSSKGDLEMMTEEMELRQWAVATALEMGAQTVLQAMAEADKLVDYVMGLSTAGRDEA